MLKILLGSAQYWQLWKGDRGSRFGQEMCYQAIPMKGLNYLMSSEAGWDFQSYRELGKGAVPL